MFVQIHYLELPGAGAYAHAQPHQDLTKTQREPEASIIFHEGTRGFHDISLSFYMILYDL